MTRLKVFTSILVLLASLPSFSATVFCTGRNLNYQASIVRRQVALLGQLDFANRLAIYSWEIIESDDEFETLVSKKPILWNEVRFIDDGRSSDPIIKLSGLSPDGFGAEYVDIEIGNSVTKSFLVKSEFVEFDSATFILTQNELTFEFSPASDRYESLFHNNNVCISTNQPIKFTSESLETLLYKKLRSLEFQMR